MNKFLFIIISLLLFSINCFPELYNRLKSEKVATVSTVAQYTIQDDGFLSISSKGSMYVSFLGTTANITNYQLVTANELPYETGYFFFKGEKLGMAAVSGTVTFNIFQYRKDYN